MIGSIRTMSDMKIIHLSHANIRSEIIFKYYINYYINYNKIITTSYLSEIILSIKNEPHKLKALHLKRRVKSFFDCCKW